MVDKQKLVFTVGMTCRKLRKLHSRRNCQSSCVPGLLICGSSCHRSMLQVVSELECNVVTTDRICDHALHDMMQYYYMARSDWFFNSLDFP